jgi:hypothetical protein
VQAYCTLAHRKFLLSPLEALASNYTIFEVSWVLLHAPKLGHGTDYFTSFPKEGMLRIFLPEKSDGFGRV